MSTDEAAYFAFKFSSICTKNLPNMHAKFDLKCINFKCILRSRKTIGNNNALSEAILLKDNKNPEKNKEDKREE